MATSSCNHHHASADPILEAFHAHRRAKEIQTAFERNTAKSQLLQGQPSKERLDALAFLSRSDIHTGKKLGEGSFAQVFEVKSIDFSSEDSCSTSIPRKQALREELNDKARQGQLVLKQIKPDVEDFIGAAADLATEAAFLMRLSHENLVNLRAVPSNFIQAFSSTDGFFLLLDRVETTLEDELKVWSKSKRGVPSLAQRVDYAQQLASVLQYLHENGIVYRDLKPDNVGLSRSTHQIQLFDFGLSRQLPSSPVADMEGMYKMSRAGTPRYMAPEVALKAQYNTQVDVYGWAILVWEMMSLSRAFSGYRSKQLCQKVYLEEERPCLKSIPMSSLQPILARAWHVKPNKRPDMASLVEQLSDVLENKSSTAIPRAFGFLRRRSAALASIPPRNAVTAICA